MSGVRKERSLREERSVSGVGVIEWSESQRVEVGSESRVRVSE